MRFNNKFKTFSQTKLFLFQLNKKCKLLKFKRPKWNNIKQFLLKRLRNKPTLRVHKKLVNKKINNHRFLKSFLKIWRKIKKTYKEGLFLTKSFKNYYDNGISIAYYKHNLFQSKVLKLVFNFLVKPLFFINILVFKLNLFKSINEANQSLKSSMFTVNGHAIKNSVFLKKGDICTIKKHANILIQKKAKYTLCSFLEFDTYTNTFIILKDFRELNYGDINLLLLEFFHLKTFMDYVKLK